MYGVNVMLLEWFKYYLENSLQRVTIDGHCSKYTKVISGVPQGG